MKTHYSVAVALVAGIALGSLGTRAVTAQPSPPGFFIADVDVTNPDEFNKYAAGVPATIEKYGGHYVIRGGKVESLEGPAPSRFVVTAFKSAADAKKWYASPEYSALRPIRERSAKSRAFIVEGVQ
jgi:uncharacterized protein (DUF1330 family)